jgi:hypothetical protein
MHDIKKCGKQLAQANGAVQVISIAPSAVKNTTPKQIFPSNNLIVKLSIYTSRRLSLPLSVYKPPSIIYVSPIFSASPDSVSVSVSTNNLLATPIASSLEAAAITKTG